MPLQRRVACLFLLPRPFCSGFLSLFCFFNCDFSVSNLSRGACQAWLWRRPRVPNQESACRAPRSLCPSLLCVPRRLVGTVPCGHLPRRSAAHSLPRALRLCCNGKQRRNE